MTTVQNVKNAQYHDPVIPANLTWLISYLIHILIKNIENTVFEHTHTHIRYKHRKWPLISPVLMLNEC